MSNVPYKIYLSEDELPKAWFDIRPFMKELPAPMLNPKTGKPCTREELSEIFCSDLVDQELNTTEAYIAIPEEIRAFYRMFRPSPVVRAYCLEEMLGTPAHIYYKFEGSNTSGS
ncbi:MAG: TrpB-like pyridoxal-phosphate dependent enzyme, partial [Clostridia bacterium]|nr:TrpB-like pyridoxal-phosphate dependent enzyme [Clostridia bacterium]